MMTDPIADMLTRIRNALMARHTTVAVPYSRFKKAIAEVLRDERYIDAFEWGGDPSEPLVLSLKYEGRTPAVGTIRRVSVPSRRVYLTYKDMVARKGLRGTLILSTPQGVVSEREARKRKIGGEVICLVS